jgi:CheY-like chemotaxis protein
MNLNEVEVFLVEDNPVDAELALSSLKKYNIDNKVHLARNGAEALELIFSNGNPLEQDIQKKTKVVLLDLGLPDIDGLKILQKLKSDDRTKEIPIIVLTSSTEEQDIVDSYQLGVNSYIVKPLDFNKFINAVFEIGLHWVLLGNNNQT